MKWNASCHHHCTGDEKRLQERCLPNLFFSFRTIHDIIEKTTKYTAGFFP
jgi:hypothetical protein